MRELLTPGVYFEDATGRTWSSPRFGRTSRSSLGLQNGGLWALPVRVTRWEQFRVRYGEFVRTGYLAYAVKGFFESGGDVCWITRVAAPERTTQTFGAQPADRRSSNVANPAGLVAGAIATLVQTRQTVTAGVQPADRLSSFVTDVSGFPQGALVQIQQGRFEVSDT